VVAIKLDAEELGSGNEDEDEIVCDRVQQIIVMKNFIS
jgi:hypothetical protein